MSCVDPGNYPVRLWVIVTSQEHKEEIALLKASQANDETYHAVLQCCHNQIQKAIPEDYLAELENDILGLADQPQRKYLTISSPGMPRSPSLCKTKTKANGPNKDPQHVHQQTGEMLSLDYRCQRSHFQQNDGEHQILTCCWNKPDDNCTL